MKWYLYPNGVRFENWQPQRMAREIVGPVALQKNEPSSAIFIDDWALLILTDDGPQHTPNQVVDSTTVNVDLQNGTATVEYSYRNKTAQEQNAELEFWRSGLKVSRFQARAALQAANLLTTVENAVLAYDEDDADFVQLAWSEAQEWRRNSPTIATLAAIVNLSDEDLDDLFIAAKEIEA